MSGKFSLKDHLFNKKSVTYFADLFYGQDIDFPREVFIKNIIKDFPLLELKQRIVRMTQELKKTLPDNYTEAVNIILEALPPELDPTLSDDDFGNFILAPCGLFIAEYGCVQEYLDISLKALRECTKRFSVEDSIRYFINTFPDETLIFLKEGATSNNYHVRRLSSEGTRPKLPWSIGIILNPQDTLPILDLLFYDTTRYVTRSVANHMNDLSKIDPNQVMSKLIEWQLPGKQNEKEMNFILQHSLRTLVKQGNTQALKLLGYSDKPRISIHNFAVETPQVYLDDYFKFNFDITSDIDQQLIIDYIIYFQMKRGDSKPKVFRITKGEFKKGEYLSLSKKHLFKLMTTKKLYPGIHTCELQINGKKYQTFSFELVL
jgi:3-methyladenine DNA glycosylase AlkC